jgi:hypothetical protein
MNTEINNTVTQDLMNTFVNLMYVGWSPEVIKHKMGLSQEMMESIHQAYYNPSK